MGSSCERMAPEVCPDKWGSVATLLAKTATPRLAAANRDVQSRFKHRLCQGRSHPTKSVGNALTFFTGQRNYQFVVDPECSRIGWST
jgi:hypothetical protein